MLLISATDAWRAAHPGAAIGLLELSGVEQPPSCPALNARKRDVETSLRERYKSLTRPELASLPVMGAYVRYYKRFTKTYHVQLQLESIVSKGKSLPDVSPLVDSNFVAELETLVLTAGHDAAKLRDPVSIDVSRDGDQIAQMNGALKAVAAGDMIMRDASGVCCSIIYGQDNRSPIAADTSHVLYVAYAPPGVSTDVVEAQLRKIEENVRLCSSAAIVLQQRVIAA